MITIYNFSYYMIIRFITFINGREGTASVTSGQWARERRRRCWRVLERPRRPSSEMCEQNDKSSRSSLSASHFYDAV